MNRYSEGDAWGVAAFFLLQRVIDRLQANQVLSRPDIEFMMTDTRNIIRLAAAGRRSQGDEEGAELFEEAVAVIEDFKANRGNIEP